MLPILYTPGSDQWRKTCEEIARLEGLLHRKDEQDSEMVPAAADLVEA